jgi:hypothetical protein
MLLLGNSHVSDLLFASPLLLQLYCTTFDGPQQLDRKLVIAVVLGRLVLCPLATLVVIAVL